MMYFTSYNIIANINESFVYFKLTTSVCFCVLCDCHQYFYFVEVMKIYF